MPKVSPIQSSFNTGELSPLLYGRVDADRYRAGLTTCLNYTPTLQGGLRRRPGTKFVSEVKDSSKFTRLIPFEFSTTQAYQLEFGDEYIRFYKDNGLVTQTAQNITGITQANPAVVTYAGSDTYANGDKVIISGVVGMTQVNNREFTVANVNTGANTFELSGVNSTGYGAYTSGGTVAEIYEITSPYDVLDIPNIRYTQSADVLYLAHPDYPPRKLTRTAHTSWALTLYDFQDGPYLATNASDTTLTPGAATGLGVTLTAGPSGRPLAATNNGAGQIRLLVINHGWSTGQQINFSGIEGATGANGAFNVTVYNSNYVDLDGSTFTTSMSAVSINSTANNGSGAVRVSTAGNHGYSTGDVVWITGHSQPDYDGLWTITVIGGSSFDLNSSTYSSNGGGGDATRVNGVGYPSLFASTDVGRHIRMKQGTVWGWAKIVSYVNIYTVTIDIFSTLTSTAAKSEWRMGAWSDTLGYPACVTFHEDRLFFAGAASYPQRLDGSKSGDYEVFSPTSLDGGDVTDDSAVSFTLNSNDVNVVRWIVSDEKGLIAGSVGGEWVIRPSSQGEALSPTNISAKRASSSGSAAVQPVQAGKAAVFVQRAGRKVLDIYYTYEADGFKPYNLTELSEHITESGIVEIVQQKEPQPTVWCLRDDGVLAAMVYERNSDSLRVGWSRHIIGGYGDAANNDAIVESISVIPSADGSRDELWMIVKRYINGATHRYVEYLTREFEEDVEQKDAFFVDCGLTYDNPLTITGITKANPAVVTSTAHGLSNGDVVLISGVEGMTEVNGETFTVANVAANTFELSGINSSSYTTYVSGGEVRKYVTTVTGLSHLEGQTVQILGDGAVQPTKTVSAGAITLSTRATTIQIGLGYNSDAQMLRLEAGAADGTSIGKTRRVNRLSMLLHRTLGLKIGMDFTSLDSVTFRRTSDELSRAVPLYSGIISEQIDADYDFENLITWRQDQPTPGMILAVMPQMTTQDR